jgi:hypothetical protein
MDKAKKKVRRATELWAEYERLPPLKDPKYHDTQPVPRAQCRECSVILRVKKSTTGSLRSHLNSFHPVIAARVINGETAAKKLEDEAVLELDEAIVADKIYEDNREGNSFFFICIFYKILFGI